MSTSFDPARDHAVATAGVVPRPDVAFRVDAELVAAAAKVLAGREELFLVLGGAGSGKTTVCAVLAARFGVEVLDLDARLYGSWHERFDAGRHPANRAWAASPDPLAWLLEKSPEELLAFHAASSAEAMDLLADELRDRPADGGPVVIDGGLASVAVPVRVIPAARIACLSLPAAARPGVWTNSAGRRGFLDMVAGVTGVPDPVARFLDLDRRLSETLDREAGDAGVHVFERGQSVSPDALATDLAAHFGIG